MRRFVCGDRLARLLIHLERTENPLFIAQVEPRRFGIDLPQALEHGRCAALGQLPLQALAHRAAGAAGCKKVAAADETVEIQTRAADKNRALPRWRECPAQASASSVKRATDQLSRGSATPTMWCGMPSVSSGVGAAVPMAMPR